MENAKTIIRNMLIDGVVASEEELSWLTDEYLARRQPITKPPLAGADLAPLRYTDYGNHFFTTGSGKVWHWESGDNIAGGNLACGRNHSWTYDVRVGDSYSQSSNCVVEGYPWYTINIYSSFIQLKTERVYVGASLPEKDIGTLSSPAIRPVEPETPGGRLWHCLPDAVNVLKLSGANIPYGSVVFFNAAVINWSPDNGTTSFTTANPGGGQGGPFSRYPLNSLVFGIGSRYIGGQNRYAFENTVGQEVWVAVNDTDYRQNIGSISVQLSWH